MHRQEVLPPLVVVLFAVLSLVGPRAAGLQVHVPPSSSISCALSGARSAASLRPRRPGARWGAHHGGGGGGSSGWRRRGRRCAGGGLRMARDFYEVLDVPETADQSEIKRAYRRKALKTHPDVNTSPNAKAEFSEVVNAYEVLSDEKKRAGYNRKRKFTNPFSRGGGGTSAGGAGGAGGTSGASWGSSAYSAAKEEATRRWREQNPTPDEIDDSFGDIFRDLFGGIASAGGGAGVLNDVVDFLENRVDGFSSDTSVEFEDLMASRNLEEMKDEAENTRLLLDQLRMKSRKLSVEKMASEKEVAATKAGAASKRFTDIEELDRQMAAIEKAAGIKARYEELQGHIKRANARLGRLERKVADLESGVGGRRATNYGSTSNGSGRSSSGANRSKSSSTYSSSRGSSRSSTQQRSGSGGGGSSESGSSSASEGSSASRSGAGKASSSSSSPPPPSRRWAPGGRRRTDDPDVEAELERMKREMGMK